MLKRFSTIFEKEVCMKRNVLHGFTLIELLIVVAIIAILAAIAVPNFLEAQVRSKVSRCRADMRSIANALESYAVDHRKYPFTLPASEDLDGYGNVRAYAYLTTPDCLTTPQAYITSIIGDPFKVGAVANVGPNQGKPYDNGDPQDLAYIYLCMRQAGPNDGDPGLGFGFFTSAESSGEYYDKWGEWRMASIGPARLYPGGTWNVEFKSIDAIYDPTNGTISKGMVVRNQKDPEGKNR